MCLSTRFPEAIPLRKIKAPSIVSDFLHPWACVQSDQCSNFMLGLFQQVMHQQGIQQFKSTVYHPQSQGALERFYQTLKSMMRAYRFEENKEWD